jgi:hypothetical protein
MQNVFAPLEFANNAPLGGQVTQHAAEYTECRTADQDLDARRCIGDKKHVVDKHHHATGDNPSRQVGHKRAPWKAEHLLDGWFGIRKNGVRR